MENSLSKHFRNYLENMAVLNLSKNTIKHRKKHGESFLQWCSDREITDPEQLTRKIAESYQRHIHRLRKLDGQPYAIKSQMIMLDGMRGLCRYLARADIIPINPTDRMQMPKVPDSLPKDILSEEEIEKVLNAPDVTSIIGIRDRTIMEVLWATGIRRAELVGLDIYSIDFSQETLMVRKGKGNRDRVVPIGKQALIWVQTYMDESRPILIEDPEETAMFIDKNGNAMSLVALSTCVRRHVLNATEKKGGCHLIRHSVGTMLMRNGLHMRLVQEILGHKKMETTQIYTHLTIMELKKAYMQAHPSACLHEPDKRKKS